jgi:hypothetical protein
MRYAGMFCGLMLALAGCGGDDDGGPGGTSQHLACDIGASTSSHACYEFSWNGPASAADQYDSACEQSGATTVSTCPSTGKVGGCKYTVTNASVTVTWINWFYFSTAAELMQACVSSGQLSASWVNP